MFSFFLPCTLRYHPCQPPLSPWALTEYLEPSAEANPIPSHFGSWFLLSIRDVHEWQSHLRCSEIFRTGSSPSFFCFSPGWVVCVLLRFDLHKFALILPSHDLHFVNKVLPRLPCLHCMHCWILTQRCRHFGMRSFGCRKTHLNNTPNDSSRQPLRPTHDTL